MLFHPQRDSHVQEGQCCISGYLAGTGRVSPSDLEEAGVGSSSQGISAAEGDPGTPCVWALIEDAAKSTVDVAVGLHSKDLLRARLHLRAECGTERNTELSWGPCGAGHAVLQGLEKATRCFLLFSVSLVTEANCLKGKCGQMNCMLGKSGASD